MKTIEKFRKNRDIDTKSASPARSPSKGSKKSNSPKRFPLKRKISLLEVSRDFGYDADGIKKNSIYFSSKHNFRQNKGDDLHRRTQSFYQQIRECDVYHCATTIKNRNAQLYSTEKSPLNERGKSLKKDVTLVPPKRRKSKIFREIRGDPQAGRTKLFKAKDVSPARSGVFIPELKSRYDNILLAQDSIF